MLFLFSELDMGAPTCGERKLSPTHTAPPLHGALVAVGMSRRAPQYLGVIARLGSARKDPQYKLQGGPYVDWYIFISISQIL